MTGDQEGSTIWYRSERPSKFDPDPIFGNYCKICNVDMRFHSSTSECIPLEELEKRQNFHPHSLLSKHGRLDEQPN